MLVTTLVSDTTMLLPSLPLFLEKQELALALAQFFVWSNSDKARMDRLMQQDPRTSRGWLRPLGGWEAYPPSSPHFATVQQCRLQHRSC